MRWKREQNPSAIRMKTQRRGERQTYVGKHFRTAEEGKRRWGWRFLAAACASLCVLAAVSSGTYSYFSSKDREQNHLEISELDFVIEEPSWEDPQTPVRPGDVLPKDPQIVNTGEMPFVVRVKIQEVWTPKGEGDGLTERLNPDAVRFFAADTGGLLDGGNFSSQQLLSILAADRQQQTEDGKNFALRQNLTPNKTNPHAEYWDPNGAAGWYRGSSQGSEWLYYNQVVPAGGRTAPVFRAVTVRTGEDCFPLDSISQEDGLTLEESYEKKLSEYNAFLTRYDLDLYVYAETVQAESFAWQGSWGDDLPAGWETAWGGQT